MHETPPRSPCRPDRPRATTAKYDYLTPTNASAVPGGSKTSTSKYCYKFREWTPALEPVQSITAYTAQFEVFVGRPTKLALDDVAVEDGHTAFTVFATLSDFSATEAAPAVGVRYAPNGRTPPKLSRFPSPVPFRIPSAPSASSSATTAPTPRPVSSEPASGTVPARSFLRSYW